MAEYNKDRIVLFINPHFVLGGVDTYFFRMTKWLRQRDMRVIYLIPATGKVDEDMLKQVIEMGAEVRRDIITYPNSSDIAPTNLDLGLPDGSDVLAITTKYFGYYEASLLQLDNPKCKFTYFNYLTHMLGFRPSKYGEENTKGIKKLYDSWRYNFYKKMSYQLFYGKEIFFMNDVHRYKFYDFYNIPHSISVMPNILLGMEVPELDEKVIEHRIQKDKFTILTVSRYEFPFKGYMVELLDQFAHLCYKYDNLELIVIGWGPHEQQFLDKVHTLPTDIQDKIKLTGSVPYEKLDDYFKESSVYVGHATTILDAGKTALPALTTGAFTMECNTDYYFHEQVEIYSMEGLHKTGEYLEKIINMTPNEYRDLSYKTYQTIKDNYAMDVVIPQVLSSYNAEKKHTLNRRQIKMFQWWYTMIMKRKKG